MDYVWITYGLRMDYVWITYGLLEFSPEKFSPNFPTCLKRGGAGPIERPNPQGVCLIAPACAGPAHPVAIGCA